MGLMTRRGLLAAGAAGIAALLPGTAVAGSVLAAGRGHIIGGQFPHARIRPGVPLSARSCIVVTPMGRSPGIALSVTIDAERDAFTVWAPDAWLPDPLFFSWAVIRG